MIDRSPQLEVGSYLDIGTSQSNYFLLDSNRLGNQGTFEIIHRNNLCIKHTNYYYLIQEYLLDIRIDLLKN
jgi:hypothetical protein